MVSTQWLVRQDCSIHQAYLSSEKHFVINITRQMIIFLSSRSNRNIRIRHSRVWISTPVRHQVTLWIWNLNGNHYKNKQKTKNKKQKKARKIDHKHEGIFNKLLILYP